MAREVEGRVVVTMVGVHRVAEATVLDAAVTKVVAARVAADMEVEVRLVAKSVTATVGMVAAETVMVAGSTVVGVPGTRLVYPAPHLMRLPTAAWWSIQSRRYTVQLRSPHSP